MNDLLRKIEQWNDEDEFGRCIQAIETIPERVRSYQLTLLLGRAYSNLAVLGDRGERSGEDDDSVDQETLAHALALFETIREQGEGDPYWNARMAYALYMAEDREEEALEYAKRWLALEPENEEAKKLVDECGDYLRQEQRREGVARLDLYDQEDRETVEDHIQQYFGQFDWVMHETVPGDYIHLDICVIPPREEHDYYTLITVGMGARTMDGPEEERAELLLNLPPDWHLEEETWGDERWSWPIGVLKALARYPMLHDTWLGWGHTVYGEDDSYAADTKLCGVILLDPGAFGRDSGICDLPNGETVSFYQVVPLYREEIEFKRAYGTDRLLEKFPDEMIEVIDPARLNVITDAEVLDYDDALMDEAAVHLAVIRDKQLPVEELAAYSHLAAYLRWCMENDLMSLPFLAAHGDVVDAVKRGEGPDLRVFLRDSEDLRGRLHLTYFDREGTAFARWYSWGSKATPHAYNRDIAAYARLYFEDDRYGKEAYLFLPWDEACYQKVGEILTGRFTQWKELEEVRGPEKDYFIQPDQLQDLLEDWDSPQDCCASDRILVDGCKVGVCYRLLPARGDEGWDSGWVFLSGDEDGAYLTDGQHMSRCDLNTLCNYDPNILHLLELPAGSYLVRGMDGQFHDIREGEEENGAELHTSRYPSIFYKRGEEIFLAPEDSGIPFKFDVSEDLTGDEQAMAAVANALDQAEELAEKAKAFLEEVLANESHEHHSTVAYFMAFHRDDLEAERVKKMFSTEDPAALTFTEMVGYLRLRRFGSFWDIQSKRQLFIMDLSFDPELTNELMVVYFGLDGQILDLAHES